MSVAVWEDIFRTRSWGRYPSEPVVQALMRLYADRDDRGAIEVLDLGCGPGANTWFLAREGFAVSGLDGSPTAIALNRQRLHAEGLRADLRVADFTHPLPYGDAGFDCVVDNVALCTTPASHMRRAISEVHRVLKPGGAFVSVCFTTRTWGYGLGTAAGEPGAYTDIGEGPLAGKGLAQFLTRDDVDDVYGRCFPDAAVNRSLHTLQCDRVIELWIIVGRKARA